MHEKILALPSSDVIWSSLEFSYICLLCLYCGMINFTWFGLTILVLRI
jgi:hypothetical protein